MKNGTGKNMNDSRSMSCSRSCGESIKEEGVNEIFDVCR